jgi:hypothetical protein
MCPDHDPGGSPDHDPGGNELIRICQGRSDEDILALFCFHSHMKSAYAAQLCHACTLWDIVMNTLFEKKLQPTQGKHSARGAPSVTYKCLIASVFPDHACDAPGMKMTPVNGNRHCACFSC